MLGPFVPFILGALLGLPLTFYYSRFRSRSVSFRLGVGLLVGIGIGFTINASAELLELAGVWRTATEDPVSSTAQKASQSKAVDDSPAEADEPSSWEQEQRYEDGTLKAKRTVVRTPEGDLMPHGPASTYHENGQLNWSGHYEMGRQTGDWEEYYPDGKKEGEGSILANGKAKEVHWHNNGKEKSRGTWRNGKKHGEWKTWFATGQQAGVFQFQDGTLHGDVREWHSNGQLKLQAQFEAGVPRVPVNRWDEDGTLISGDGNNSP